MCSGDHAVDGGLFVVSCPAHGSGMKYSKMRPENPATSENDLYNYLLDRRRAHELPHAATVGVQVLDADHAMDWCLKMLPSYDWAWDIIITNELDERWLFRFRHADDAALFTLTWG